MLEGADDGHHLELMDRDLVIQQLKNRIEQLQLEIEQINEQKAEVEAQKEESDRRVTELAYKIRDQDLDLANMNEEASDVIGEYNMLVDELEGAGEELDRRQGRLTEHEAEIEALRNQRDKVTAELNAQR